MSLGGDLRLEVVAIIWLVNYCTIKLGIHDHMLDMISKQD